MYKTVINSVPLRASVLGAALIAVAALGFFIGMIREGNEGALREVSFVRTYSSPVLGIAFEYVHENEVVEAVREYGECPQGAVTAADGCDHRYLGFRGKNHVSSWFLSAESALFARYPIPREPSREDTLHTWDINRYCEEGLYPLSCEKSTNSHGLAVVKVGYMPACNGFEDCGNEAFFVTFVETKNPAYPVVALWHDRSEERAVPDTVIDSIIDSMRSLPI